MVFLSNTASLPLLGSIYKRLYLYDGKMAIATLSLMVSRVFNSWGKISWPILGAGCIHSWNNLCIKGSKVPWFGHIPSTSWRMDWIHSIQIYGLRGGQSWFPSRKLVCWYQNKWGMHAGEPRNIFAHCPVSGPNSERQGYCRVGSLIICQEKLPSTTPYFSLR